MGGVPLDQRRIAALRALRPAQAGNPGVGAGQRAPQRLHLAHLAAALAPGHAGVEQVGAFAAHHLLHRRCIREQHLVAHPVAAHRARHQVVSLLVQAPGIEHEDARPRLDGQQHVGQHLVLGAQRGSQRDPVAVPLHQGAKQRLRPAPASRRQCLDGGCGRRLVRGLCHVRHIWSVKSDRSGAARNAVCPIPSRPGSPATPASPRRPRAATAPPAPRRSTARRPVPAARPGR